MASGGRVPGPGLVDVAFLAVYWDDAFAPKAEAGSAAGGGRQQPAGRLHWKPLSDGNEMGTGVSCWRLL